MVSFWQKVNYLVPEPNCRCSERAIVEWKDSRPKPTLSQINAVTDQQTLENSDEEFITSELARQVGNPLEILKRLRKLGKI